jgi:hypothetical protein
VSDSIGVSSGSVSGASERSSDSSRTRRTARGDYDVVEVASAATDPAATDGAPALRLTLQSVAEPGDAGRLFLTLPQTAADRAGVGQVGQRVTATPRPYGTEFARADTRRAFFLVLDDEWLREIAPQAVPM